MNCKKNIALIGMPAVGKSTVGVLLAKKMGYDFMDTDIIIQTKRTLKPLPRSVCLSRDGTFSGNQKNSMFQVSAAPAAVIATGGSVVYKELSAMHHLAPNLCRGVPGH
ncbi:MAG: shikimate kinase [Desulfotignum sp.]|nr:shikimate kinase [Desulfotignum sp.]